MVPVGEMNVLILNENYKDDLKFLKEHFFWANGIFASIDDLDLKKGQYKV